MKVNKDFSVKKEKASAQYGKLMSVGKSAVYSEKPMKSLIGTSVGNAVKATSRVSGVSAPRKMVQRKSIRTRSYLK